MPRASWSGSITFAGFPLPVKAYNFTSSSKDEGFKTLCKCHGKPIAQKNTCATDGTVLADADKGVEVSKSTFVVLDATAVDAITNAAGKSVALEAERVCPTHTLDLHMSTGGYSIVPEDGKGAEKPVAILWRVLQKTDRAIVTRFTGRAGSKDVILAITAGPKGLVGNVLPHAHQLSGAPAGDCANVAVTDAEIAMFEGALMSMYPQGDFVAADFPSQYKEHRKTAIDAAIAGNPVVVAAAPEPAAVPDLMAALAASLAATPVAVTTA
jgi:non-homologous end joining protein Ku